MIYDVVIVGAGAAGLYAGALIPGQQNLILEGTDSPGKKLLMAGGGQCNLTHDGSIKAFVTRYGANGKAIRALLYRHSNTALMQFWQRLGLPLTARADGKMFPATFSARDVLDCLLAACRKNGFSLLYHQKVEQIEPQPGGLWRLNAVHPQTKKKTAYIARHVILSCGGRSYPSSGSDGSILRTLKRLDIPVISQRPALSPIYVPDYPYGALSGVSVADVQISIFASLHTPDAAHPPHQQSKPLMTVTGDLLFTHECFSGPAALHAARYLHDNRQNDPVNATVHGPAPADSISINYIPGEDMGLLTNSLLQVARGSKKQASSLLYARFGERLPSRLIDSICVRQCLEKNTACSQLTKSQLKGILHMLTSDVYSAAHGRFSGAMATAGGVALDAVDFKTCSIVKYPRLYIIGELLDIDGDTGGYNLQFAFSSAAAAADAVCQSIHGSEDSIGF